MAPRKGPIRAVTNERPRRHRSPGPFGFCGAAGRLLRQQHPPRLHLVPGHQAVEVHARRHRLPALVAAQPGLLLRAGALDAVVQRFAEQPEGRYLLDEDEEQKARSAMVGEVVAKALGDMSPDAQANYYRLMQAGADTLCQRKALFNTVYGSVLSGLAKEDEEPGEAYQTEGITCKFSPRFPGRPALLVQYQNTNESFGSFGTLLQLALVDASGEKVLVAGAKVAGPGARQSTLSKMAAHILKCFDTYSGLSEDEIRALVEKQNVYICSPVVPYTLEY